MTLNMEIYLQLCKLQLTYFNMLIVPLISQKTVCKIGGNHDIKYGDFSQLFKCEMLSYFASMGASLVNNGSH